MIEMVAAELQLLLDARIVDVVDRRSGYSTARCWSVVLANESRVFVKVAEDDEAIGANRNEATVLANVASQHLPSLVALSDDARILVIEDLSNCDWGPPVDRLDALWDAVADIGSIAGPTAL